MLNASYSLINHIKKTTAGRASCVYKLHKMDIHSRYDSDDLSFLQKVEERQALDQFPAGVFGF